MSISSKRVLGAFRYLWKMFAILQTRKRNSWCHSITRDVFEKFCSTTSKGWMLSWNDVVFWNHCRSVLNSHKTLVSWTKCYCRVSLELCKLLRGS
jgi:hypothetical protein